MFDHCSLSVEIVDRKRIATTKSQSQKASARKELVHEINFNSPSALKFDYLYFNGFFFLFVNIYKLHKK